VLKERVFFAGGHIAIRGRWKLEQAAKKKITPEPNHWKESKWFRPHDVTVSWGSVGAFPFSALWTRVVPRV